MRSKWSGDCAGAVRVVAGNGLVGAVSVHGGRRASAAAAVADVLLTISRAC